MSALTIYRDNSTANQEHISDYATIASRLNNIGVQFERWRCDQPLSDDAEQEAVLNAYSDAIDRLKQQYNFQSVDVVSLEPDHPDKVAMRSKFLAEHTHADFEIRFFVDGQGLFYIHTDNNIYMVLCEKGDLISVPANTPHWFDMGENPDFKCIRLFTTAEGWVANATGSDIAKHYPDFDQYLAGLS